MIIETDLGSDPDDLFAIIWLISVGIKIDAITLVPGSTHQVLLANFIKDQLQQNFRVGTYSFRENNQYANIYKDLIKRYKIDNLDHEDAKNIYQNINQEEKILIIGPPKNITFDYKVSKIVMQGGFCPYSIHRPSITLPKFENQHAVQSFNVNGQRTISESIGRGEKSNTTYFVGKNVCHTLYYDREIHKRYKPHNQASQLFKDILDMYLQEKEGKVFHDAVAAYLMLKPQHGLWIHGNPIKTKDGWTTNRCPPHYDTKVLVDIDRELFWNNIVNFSLE